MSSQSWDRRKAQRFVERAAQRDAYQRSHTAQRAAAAERQRLAAVQHSAAAVAVQRIAKAAQR